MVTMCDVCAARKAVIDDKLRARGGVLHDLETRRFEAYLYSQTPLCAKCGKLEIAPRDVIGRIAPRDVIGRIAPRDVIAHDGTEKSGTEKQSGKTNLRVLGLLAVTMATLSLIISLMIINNSDEVRSLRDLSLSDVARRSRDLVAMVTRRSRDLVAMVTRYEMLWSVGIEEVVYSVGIEEVVYSTVCVIQLMTVFLRQHHIPSLLLALISLLLWRYAASGELYVDVTRYSLLGLALLLLFTKKSIVVTTLKRKPTQKPIIKVRRSPRKKSETSSSPVQGLFSEDEDDSPKAAVFETASISRSLLDISRDTSHMSRDTSHMSRDTSHMPRDTSHMSRDVSSRFNIMKISSPVKKNFSSPGRHVSCLKPARFSLDRNGASSWSRDASPRSRDASPWSRDTSPWSRDTSPCSRDTAVSDVSLKREVRPRFDSTGTEADTAHTGEEIPTQESSIPLKPILVILIVSVVMNYYLIVSYVLRPDTEAAINPKITF